MAVYMSSVGCSQLAMHGVESRGERQFPVKRKAAFKFYPQARQFSVCSDLKLQTWFVVLRKIP